MKQHHLSAGALIKRVFSFTKPFRKPLFTVFICIFIVAIVDALGSIYLSKIFDIVQNHGTDRNYLNSALILVGSAMAFLMMRILVVGYQSRTDIKKLDLLLVQYLSHESIAKFFSFSNGQHVSEHSGVKQTIVNSGTTSIETQIRAWIFQLFPAASHLLVALGGLFYANALIGGIFLGIAALFSFLMFKHNKLLIPGIRKLRDRKQLNSRFISELYRFVTVVKNESQERRSLEELNEKQGIQHQIYTTTWLPGIARLQGIRISTALCRYGALFLVVYLVFTQEMSIGAMFLVFTWSSLFMNSLWEVTNIHKQFLIDRINIEKYLQLLDVIPDIVMIENPIRPEKILGRIEFKNVTFHYPHRVKSYEEDNELEEVSGAVLSNISFVIEPGQKIGVVGESGSGKSTILSLLKRNFDPQEGQVIIDDNDLRLLDLRFFLRKVGSVDQEVSLFDRSIRDNILFGLNGDATSFSVEKLHEIGKLARIDGFFDRLEYGYDTLIGEKGVKLSGGERQRVGIARALAKDPSILIFDEATSALDSVSEKIVQASIDVACKGKTSIVVAHRLSTIKNCDKIFVFRHGLLLAVGTHKELLKKCEYYAELARPQMVEQSTH